MTNKTRGEFKHTIGGVEFTFVPSFRRIAKLEGALGRSLIQIGRQLEDQGMTVMDLAVMVNTLASEPEKTVDEIGTLILKSGAPSTFRVLAEVLDVVLGGTERGGDDEGNVRAGGAPSGG